MIKQLTSKTALFVALTAGFIALAVLAFWAQTVRAQTSDVVSVSVSQTYGDDTDGSDITSDS